MYGMSSDNGEIINGTTYLEQVVRDVLTTPVGSRVMRRNYGSRLYTLLDHPIDEALIANMHVAVVEALTAHVPIITISAVEVLPIDYNELGKMKLTILGYLISDNRPVEIKNIIV